MPRLEVPFQSNAFPKLSKLFRWASFHEKIGSVYAVVGTAVKLSMAVLISVLIFALIFVLVVYLLGFCLIVIFNIKIEEGAFATASLMISDLIFEFLIRDKVCGRWLNRL